MTLLWWVEDTYLAIDCLLEHGAHLLSKPHDFLDHLIAGWVCDPNGNPFQIVVKERKT